MSTLWLLLLSCGAPVDTGNPSPGPHLAPEPCLEVSPNRVAFEPALVWVDPVQAAVLNLTNPCDSEVEIRELTITGDAHSFVVAELEASLLAPGESEELKVWFYPNRVGEWGLQLLFHLDPPALAPSASLLGEGRGPLLEAQPRELDFGEVPVGTEVEGTLVVTNRGTADVEIVEARLSTNSTDLTLSPLDLPATLSPGEDGLNVSVRYRPGEEGEDIGFVTLQAGMPFDFATAFLAVGSGTDPGSWR